MKRKLGETQETSVIGANLNRKPFTQRLMEQGSFYVKLILLLFVATLMSPIVVHAGTITDTKLDGTKYTGTVLYGCSEYYYFTTSKSGEIKLTFARESISYDKLRIRLVDKDSDTILAVGRGAIEKDITPGDYYAEIFWYDCMQDKPSIPYTFSATFTEKTVPDNTEVDKATQMVPGEKYTENLSAGLGYDLYYKILVEKESLVIIQNPGRNFKATLYSDEKLTNVEARMSENFSKKYTFMTLDEGTYYMKVEAADRFGTKVEISMDLVEKPEVLQITTSKNSSGLYVLNWTHDSTKNRTYHVYTQTNGEWKLLASNGSERNADCKDEEKIILSGNTVSYDVGVMTADSLTMAVVAVDRPNHIDVSSDYYGSDMYMEGDVDEAALTLKKESSDSKSLKKPTISSVKNSSKRKVTVKWKKYTAAKTMELQYSTSSKFTKKTTTTKKVTASKGKITLSGMKLKKTYYIRIRGKNASKTSKWSAVKKIKITK